MGEPDDTAKRHLEEARAHLRKGAGVSVAEMTERKCACCGLLYLFAVEIAGVDVFGCPNCDRIRCRVCKQPFGLMHQPAPRTCDSCGERQ
jgi:hypothetical protein